MGDPRKANCDDFDTPEDRNKFALDLREGLDVDGAIEDWGDLDTDVRGQTEEQTDVHCSTSEEVQTYYDETRPSGWWVL